MSSSLPEQADPTETPQQSTLHQQPSYLPAASRAPVKGEAPKDELVSVKQEQAPEQQQQQSGQPQSLQYHPGLAQPNGGLSNGAAPSSSGAMYDQPPPNQISAAQPSSRQPEGPPGQNGAAGKQVSTGDIQRVQNYIEACLQQYLSQKEVITQLQSQFRIEPCFTQLVWQKLEEQNQEFFKAYYTRLKLKDQIILFNHLLEEQVKMFHRSHLLPGGVAMQSGVAYPQGFSGPMGQATGPMQPGQQPGIPGQLSHHHAASAGFHNSDGASQAAHLNADPHQLSIAEFPGIGIEGGAGDLPSELAGIGQSLPFSGSEINLANLVSFGSPGRGALGSLNDHVDLSGLPRNFSLSDLALDQVNDAEHGLPHSISLSDFPAFDLDSGGEHG